MKRVYLSVDKSTKVIKSVFLNKLYDTLVTADIQDDVEIHILRDKWINGTLVSDYDAEEENRKGNIYKQIQALKQKLAKSDYLAIKYAEGELTEEEYAPHKLERQTWRKTINELEKEL